MTVLFVALTIALFLVADAVILRMEARRAAAPAAGPEQGAPVRLPGGVFFAPSHTWLSLFPTGHAWMGIDDFVTRLLERPRVRFLVEAGSRVVRGEPILRLEEGERALTVRSPMDGRILAWNEDLTRRPELLTGAPFCEGWACDLRPDRADDLKALLLGDEAHGWMQEEFRRLRDLFAGAGPAVSPAMLQDGGPPIAGAMKHVGEEVWLRFEREFLDVR